jgi:hypothetical protein
MKNCPNCGEELDDEMVSAGSCDTCGKMFEKWDLVDDEEESEEDDDLSDGSDEDSGEDEELEEEEEEEEEEDEGDRPPHGKKGR